MSRTRAHPLIATALALVVIIALATVVYAGYLAGEAGRLPWQEDPTRIPVTPFGDIPGFTPPTPLPTASDT